MHTQLHINTLTHTHTLGRTKWHKHTHLLLLSYKCSCAPKQQCKWHYYNTREHPVTILYDELSQTGMPVNLLENRSLYWDIHQSHHCGLPDAARAHQDIRYWKLTGGFGNNKNISPDASAVSRPDSAAMLHAGWYNCMNAAVVFWGFFRSVWRQKTWDFWELEFTGNLFRSFVETFSLVVNVRDGTNEIKHFTQKKLIHCRASNCHSSRHVNTERQPLKIPDFLSMWGGLNTSKYLPKQRL